MKHMDGFGRDKEHITKKQMSILKIKSMLIEVKNAFEGLLSRLDIV